VDGRKEPNFVAIGAATMFVGVALGAFGAHALKETLGEVGRPIYETGVIYHLVHGLALLLVGILQVVRPGPRLATVGWLFLVGTVLFSGSLYVLAVTGVKLWGAVTPFGGLCYLVGWAMLAFGGLRRASSL
jgi:uncharacterized membrane protein YgdD (TMEM256/DUF423 family)